VGRSLKITFDYQIFSSQVQGGISRYFLELARHLSRVEQVEILAPAFVTTNLQQSYRDLLSPSFAAYDRLSSLVAGTGLKAREASWRRRVNQRVSRWYLGRAEPDVFHETFFEADPLPLKSARRVLTVQDMIDELILLPDGRTSQAFVDVKRAAIERADHVLVSSKQSQIDLLKLIPIAETKTTVVHLGCRALGEWPAPAGLADDLPPYMLFVGSRDTYKNFDGLLRAFAMSPRLLKSLTLVAFGGGPFTAGERGLAAQLGIPEARMVQRDGDDRGLADLYRRARLCVYPSFYEGFGLIPLEAMTLGCPVVTTHGGSLAEVVVNAGEVVDPAFVESICAGLERVAFDEARRTELTTAGIAHAATFTWQRCADETLAVYRSLA